MDDVTQKRNYHSVRTCLLQNSFNFWVCSNIIDYLTKCYSTPDTGNLKLYTTNSSLHWPAAIDLLIILCIKQAVAILIHSQFYNRLLVVSQNRKGHTIVLRNF
jgi:hypothetical protein